ncbi:N-acetylmuramic acid 6-phosphate etherase [Pseudarthrobacter sp. J1738]|uniref:N-acetylmuramic acid 6-phosphate etherase n=1 Tax=unclassified Pseudarthrobacter TaxID=2647000 RepID=UPI003D2DEEF6
MNQPAESAAYSEDLGPLRAELASLATERSNPDFQLLDTMSTSELVAAMNGQDALVAAAVSKSLGQIAQAVDAVTQKLAAGGRLIYTGAGTAGRIGVLDASECPPTFGTPAEMVVGVIAGGSRAVQHAVENAEDNVEAGAADLHALKLNKNDAVIGISASGRTPYVLGALAAAREVGAFSAAIACNTGSAIGQAADVAIEVEVGPEFVTGSTRLKSGTAQKLVVNMISTLSMVKLGKTYGNLMVDLQATNAKLRARSQRTVQQATGVDADQAANALEAADGSVKLAILLLLTGVTPDAGRAALGQANGFLREAITKTR